MEVEGIVKSEGTCNVNIWWDSVKNVIIIVH